MGFRLSPGAGRAGQDPVAFEKGLRDSMLLPANTRMIYRDHEGEVIPLEQFVASAQQGMRIDVTRDEAAGTATFTLAAATAEEAAIGPVKHLPPLDLKDLYGRRIRNLDLAGRPT